jgi:flagellar motility protein MotE (MotC chaperone)
MTPSKLIDRVDKSIRRGDLPGAFRNQLASLREQTEAAETGFEELEARIKELEAQIQARIKEREARIEVQIKESERSCRSSPESKANSRKQRSLKRIVRSVFGVRRGRLDWRG